MQINQLRLFILSLGLAILQLIINATTIFYLDCLAVILVILLINGKYSIRLLVVLALIADLIGHWYLGTHLFACITLSFLSRYCVNFYRMCNPFQKVIMVGLFYSLFRAIMFCIGLITHNSHFAWLNYSLEIIGLAPLILWLFNSWVIKISADLII
ncbi:MAG: hypothetical protein ACK4M7_04575 [Burkholderiales bacterium]